MKLHSRFTTAFYFAALIMLCDQITKYWIVNKVMQPPDVVPVMPHFNLVLVWNKGVTFGLLNNVDHKMMTWILVGVAIGLGAVMGGAIGNIIDRLNYGAVVDFLDFYYHNYHWYAFNIADAAIVMGVGFLLLDSVVRGR